ncbi:prenylcysteine oxidase-like [Diaphorina citri]|uniref:Prenylcysteine oxidase-like n=1 Tax=Diaphorina citri TaxID=121845 RepID=A0A1S3CX95_DIACI|nr:prenylcysteine oxidase-like [Diaphorina citri]XP_026677763.1 prenylcysteine oxidase-like [Diaphorina citri]
MVPFGKLTLVAVLCIVLETCHAKVRIGIVGAGIGGTSACYFLQELLKDQVTIDIYEPHEIGGRLATAKVDDFDYETGGSIIHEDNLYVQRFMKEFGLVKKVDKKTNVPSKFGLYDGSQFHFKESSYHWITILKLLYRYGPVNFYRFQSAVDTMLTEFRQIYTVQSQNHSFTTVEELLASMSPRFVPQMRLCAEDAMKTVTSQLLLDELVSASNLVNYGQTIFNMPGFVTYVSCAGMSGELFAIRGGNKQLASHLLSACSGNLLRRKVRKIEYNLTTGTYVVHSVKTDTENAKNDERKAKNPEDEKQEGLYSPSNEDIETESSFKSANKNAESTSSGYESAEEESTKNFDSANKESDYKSTNEKDQSANKKESDYQSANKKDSSKDFESANKDSSNAEASAKEYDYIIVATPISLSDIEFINMGEYESGVQQHFSTKYHVTVTTLVQGKNRTKYCLSCSNETKKSLYPSSLNKVSCICSTRQD